MIQRLNLLPVLLGILLATPSCTMANEQPDERLKSLQGMKQAECSGTPNANCVDLQEQILALYRDLHGDAAEGTLNVMGQLAAQYELIGRYDDAERLYLEALRSRRDSYKQALANRPKVVNRQDAMVAEMSRGNPAVLQALKNNPEYMAKLAQAQQLAPLLQEGRRAKNDVPDPKRLFESLDDLGDFYVKRQRFSEAEPILVEALQLRRQMYEDSSKSTSDRQDHQAAALQLLQQAGAGGEQAKQAMAALQVQGGIGATDTMPVIRSLTKLGDLYKRQGRPDAAAPLFEEIINLRKQMPDDGPDISQLSELLGAESSGGGVAEVQQMQKMLNFAQSGRRQLDQEKRIDEFGQLAATNVELGQYQEAEKLYRQALEISRPHHGEMAPETLALVNGLANVHVQLGRDDLAEIAYKDVSEAFRETPKDLLNEGEEATMALASLYQRQKREGERQQLLADMKQVMASVWERSDLESPLTDADATAGRKIAQARSRDQFRELTAIMGEGLELMRSMKDARDSKELDKLEGIQQAIPSASKDPGGILDLSPILRELGHGGEMSNKQDGRMVEALTQGGSCQGAHIETIEETLQHYSQTLGDDHHLSGMCQLHLAHLYIEARRFDDVPALLERTDGYCKSLENPGDRLMHTSCLVQLADRHHRIGQLEEAEDLYNEALEQDPNAQHRVEPDAYRLIGLNGLAALLTEEGRITETEVLYAEALDHLITMDPNSGDGINPQVLTTRLRHAGALAANDEIDKAVATLRQIEPQLLDWTSIQLASTGSVDEKRDHLKRRQDFQNLVLTLATRYPDNSRAVALAGDVILRWKQFQSAEDALLAKLARNDADPKVRALAEDVRDLSGKLASLTHGSGSVSDSVNLLKELQDKEQELARISAPYKRQLAIGDTALTDVHQALPGDSALIEFRHYKPRDLQTGMDGERRWAALLLSDGHDPVVMDLVDIKATSALLGDLLQRDDSKRADQAAVALHQHLFEPLTNKAGKQARIYIALDGSLSLMPIDRLMLPDGRYWGDVQDLRFLQTGRGLLAPSPGAGSGDGLLALGGIDFEDADNSLELASIEPAAGPRSIDVGDGIKGGVDRARRKLEPFAALMGTAQEVDAIKAAYSRSTRGERVTVWSGAEATEAALKQIGQGGNETPKILHLATHGFFLRGDGDELGRPELDSGIALAGANRTIRGDVTAGEDDSL